MQAQRVRPEAGRSASPSTVHTSATRRFHELLDDSTEAVLLRDAAGRLRAANPAACTELLCIERQVCANGWAGLQDHSDGQRAGGSGRSSLKAAFVQELTLLRGDGSTFPAQVFASVAEGDEGETPLRLLIVRDVSPQVAASAELAEYRQHFEGLVRERAGELREAGGLLREGLDERQLAQDALAESERRYRSLFEDSPVAMREEDHSAVKVRLEELTAAGVSDVAAYLREHADECEHLLGLVRTLGVNRAALELFEAQSADELSRRSDRGDAVGAPAGLPAFWAAALCGARSARSEAAGRTLAGRELLLLETCIVAPGHEDSLDRVYVADVDVSEHRRAQAELAQTSARLERALKAAVVTLGSAAELRDPYTAGHQRRVAELAAAIAAELGWTRERIEPLRTAALLHDIGKLVVPAEILSKPGGLSENEMRLIRDHASAGADILADIDFDDDIAEMVRQHHERLDGSGYPLGLSGEAILPEVRILAVADVVEAKVSHRPYRPALSLEQALASIEDDGGRRYDADAGAACIRLLRERRFSL
jgi:putative nucleotidyltransferase with HDIG domain